jgi:hypothetical protein
MFYNKFILFVQQLSRQNQYDESMAMVLVETTSKWAVTPWMAELNYYFPYMYKNMINLCLMRNFP